MRWLRLLIHLDSLAQDRLAKTKEENKTLLEERERAEEERDDLEAQVLACGYLRVRDVASRRADVRTS